MSLTIKNPRGWFAAGSEVARAMTTLSDGAFKLFVYLCLNAQRETGILETSQTQLARNIKKGLQTTRSYLREMESAGVCRGQFSHSPLGRGVVEITSSVEPETNGSAAFVAEIKKMLQARACVRTSLSTADEILAREWFDSGTTLERIEQAILMGCIRKYVSWRNNQTRTLIGSLRYFVPVLDELQGQKIDPEYWGYLRYRLGHMENHWKENYGKSLSMADRTDAIETTSRSTTEPSEDR